MYKITCEHMFVNYSLFLINFYGFNYYVLSTIYNKTIFYINSIIMKIILFRFRKEHMSSFECDLVSGNLNINDKEKISLRLADSR